MVYSKCHTVIFEQQNVRGSRQINVTFIPEQSSGEKTLLVRLSDESDLYFLYSCRISDDVFSSLKVQQGLLVDFSGFEQKVIDLLELCLSEENSPSPKYTLKFTLLKQGGEALLQIIEATNFKYLVHLSLSLRAADDEMLKAYLVEQLQHSKSKFISDSQRLTASLADVSFRLTECEKKLTSSETELSRVKAESQLNLEELKRSYEERLHVYEKNLCDAEEKHKNVLLDHQRVAAQDYERLRSELNSQLTRLTKENSELKDEREHMDSKVRRLTNQVNSLEEQVASQTIEITSLHSKLQSTEEAVQKKSLEVSKLTSRLDVTEKEVAAKDNLLSKTQELLNSEQALKSKLQEELQQTSRQSEKLQSSLDRESEEVTKANEIIKRLQTEVKSHHNKAKLRGQVAAEQERLLTSKDSELQELRGEMNRLKLELKESKDSISQLKEQVQSTSAELSDAQQTIKTNENIINWLNRQISESQIGHVQNRLRSNGFPTPINAIGSIRPVSPPTGIGSNANNLQIAPPWHPSVSSSIPSSTIITRPTPNPPVTSPNILPGIPRQPIKTGSGINGTANGSVGSRLSNPNGANDPTETRSRNPPFDLDSNILSKNNDVRHKTLPAPMTKSTPLHTEYIPPRSGSNSTSTAARLGPSTLTMATSTQPRNPLPTYVPSVLTKQTQPTVDGIVPNSSVGVDNYRPTSRQTYGGLCDKDDSDRTAHQQSLTSAYFPKSVGATQPR